MSKDPRVEYELLREKKTTDVLEIMNSALAPEPAPRKQSNKEEKES